MLRNRVMLLGVVLLVVVAWALLGPTPSALQQARAASPRVAKAEPEAGEPLAHASRLGVQPLGEHESQLITLGERQEVDPTMARGPGLTEDAARDLLDGLIKALDAAERSTPATYHEVAAGLLSRFVFDLADSGSGITSDLQSLGEDLLARLATGIPVPRVRGALWALLGTWGFEKQLLDRLPAGGEEWRSGVAGLCWVLEPESSAWGRAGLTLPFADLAEVLNLGGQMGGLTALPAVFSRQPDEDLRDAIMPRVTRVALDLEGLLDRRVALLALGTLIDDDAGVLGTLRELLFSSEAVGLQVQYTVLFVLTRARSPAAHRVARDFIDDEQIFGGTKRSSLLKARAEIWLAENPSTSPDFDRMANSLLDEQIGQTEKIGILIGLSGMMEQFSEDDAMRAEELLVELVRSETQDGVRLSGISMLSEMNGGPARLAALDRALRTSADTTERLLAARGLGHTLPPLDGEALALLRRHLPDESEQKVIDEIESLLGLDG